MHRLTRFATCTQLSSAESTRSLAATLRHFSTRPRSDRTQKINATTLRHFSTRPRSDRTQRIVAATAMDPIQPAAIGGDAAEGEDFVHVEGQEESLSGSFASVDYVDDSPAVADGVEELPRRYDESDEEAVARRELPEEMMRNVVRLSCESVGRGGVCDVYLVGTAHVSQDSCREVQAVVSFLKPQVVFLELCSGRVSILTAKNLKIPTTAEMVDMWKKKHNLFQILYGWFLAKVAGKLEVLPGAEFRTAYEEAIKYGGKVILGDRPVQVTIRRTWAKMPLWHKTKFIFSLLFQSVFVPSADELNKMLKELDDSDAITLVIQEMGKKFPTLMETLLNERDRYMSCTLLGVAKQHSSVVAVVGRGHLQGIKKNWEQPVSLEELMEVPMQKKGVSVVKMCSVAVAGVAIVSAIYFKSKK